MYLDRPLEHDHRERDQYGGNSGCSCLVLAIKPNWLIISNWLKQICTRDNFRMAN